MLQVNMENTEQRGTGIENGSEWSDGTVHFDRTGPTEQSGPSRKVDRFSRNFSGWTEPIHSTPRNFRTSTPEISVEWIAPWISLLTLL